MNEERLYKERRLIEIDTDEREEIIKFRDSNVVVSQRVLFTDSLFNLCSIVNLS
jgi:hypothetical protein